MNRLTLLLALCLAFLDTFGQNGRNETYQRYIEQYRDIAVEQMHRHGIPASITLAQGLLESAAGRSMLAVNGNNHFGIKCHDWTGKTMRRDDDAPNECFRIYDTAAESYEDHSKFLVSRPRYKSLFSLSRTDYAGWARGLKACGYATSPTYAQSLIRIIELYGLDEYDHIRAHKKRSATHNATVTAEEYDFKHQIHYNNGNYYIIANQGETFAQLGEEFSVSRRKLAKYNERNAADALSAGDIVYLKKKRTKADKALGSTIHTVRAGESMHDIAQKYGIRLRSLYKMNGFALADELRAGDRLKLR